MQIYTRTGDKGKTKIIGGSALYKDDDRIEAYGTIDELNSLIGLITVSLKEWQDISNDLLKIQHYLFDCGNDLATPADDKRYSYRVSEELVDWLEDRIDFYEPQAPEIKTFILPGGSEIAALFHLARTTCRRAERRIVTFIKNNDTNLLVLKFINRLSDLLFAWARVSNTRLAKDDIPYDRGGEVFHLDIDKNDIFDEAPDL